jgi:hypothetical protein
MLSLNARRTDAQIEPDALYNLAIEKFENGEGTLYWRSWDLFDQIIVSGNILSGGNTYKLEPRDLQILKEDWMLFKNSRGVLVPNRMAGRSEYYGGFSDHLPVFIRFAKN